VNAGSSMSVMRGMAMPSCMKPRRPRAISSEERSFSAPSGTAPFTSCEPLVAGLDARDQVAEGGKGERKINPNRKCT
jgi:hypothetical protein